MLTIAKILTQLAYPLTLCLVLVPLGLALRGVRWRRLGAAGIVLGVGVLLVFSLPEVSFRLRAGLERQFQPQEAAAYPSADAILVLGGGIEGARSPWRDMPNLAAAADRVWFGAKLYHSGRAPRVILSGGAFDDDPALQREAPAMAAFMEDLGVPASALLLEATSRNTWENAVESRRLMQEHGIERVLLVTSALHMRRALAIFRQLDIAVIPAPTDFEAAPPSGPVVLRWLPDAEALFGSSRALKEYLGDFAYRLRGWTAKAQEGRG